MCEWWYVGGGVSGGVSGGMWVVLCEYERW